MATNPFDDPDGRFVVLVNERGASTHCGPPVPAAPMAGSRYDRRAAEQECTTFIEANWTDAAPPFQSSRQWVADRQGTP